MTNQKSNRWFFTADCHFGHANIIKYCNRPFLNRVDQGLCDLIKKGIIDAREVKIDQASVELMDQTITQSINSVVMPDDNLVIVGDFCLAKGRNRKNDILRYRNQIECKNVYLILGNHDDRNDVKDVFTACYENYLFNINGQFVFTSHYPARSWDRAFYGAWMIYGHVHNLYHDNDNGNLSKNQAKSLEEGFSEILAKWNTPHAVNIVPELLQACTCLYGADLTLDVGVDNVRPDKPFGTPWSMDEIREYMQQKMPKWLARKQS